MHISPEHLGRKERKTRKVEEEEEEEEVIDAIDFIRSLLSCSMGYGETEGSWVFI